MNNEPVMFEWPVASGKYHSIYLNAEELSPNSTGAIKNQLREIQLMSFAQRDAQLKAQGWLSPEDQRPFCVNSAIELEVEFQEDPYYLVGNSRRNLFVSYNAENNLFIGSSCGAEYEIYDFNWFHPYNNPHECARLVELGVKRYEQKAGK